MKINFHHWFWLQQPSLWTRRSLHWRRLFFACAILHTSAMLSTLFRRKASLWICLTYTHSFTHLLTQSVRPSVTQGGGDGGIMVFLSKTQQKSLPRKLHVLYFLPDCLNFLNYLRFLCPLGYLCVHYFATMDTFSRFF